MGKKNLNVEYMHIYNPNMYTQALESRFWWIVVPMMSEYGTRILVHKKATATIFSS